MSHGNLVDLTKLRTAIFSHTRASATEASARIAGAPPIAPTTYGAGFFECQVWVSSVASRHHR
jgi:hypothetical protein